MKAWGLLGVILIACGSPTDAVEDSDNQPPNSSGGSEETGGRGGGEPSNNSGGTAAGTGGITSEPSVPSYFDFSEMDNRGATTEDFSPMHFKGQCAAGEVMTGLSVEATCGAPRVLQCELGQVVSTPTATASPFCGDSRRDEETGDWDYGFRKGECGATEAVVGISRDTEGGLHDLLCAELNVETAGSCTVRNVNAGDNRGKTSTGNWDEASAKSECSAGEYVKGVSLDAQSRRPHAILCCSASGPNTVRPALNPEPETMPNSCRPDGADTTITAFDNAHMTGGSRYVYQKVEFPSAGSYERITMTFSLGCPANGCDPWDRWGNLGIVLKKDPTNPDRDEILELGRFVTPYGVGGTFTYDLTSLRPALRGTLELRIFVDTWVDGWLATARIEMKSGKPEKEPSFVTPLWTVPHVGVGVGSRSIADTVPPRELKVPQAVCDVGVRAIITGHGQGNRDNCAEFCPKKHYIEVGASAHERVVWRDDCATTAVPDQLGTWQYSRAGWCPGADVRALDFAVGSDVSSDAKAGKTPFEIGYNVEGYENTCRPGNCDLGACVFGTSCDYNGGSHTEPFYSLTAVVIGYR